MNFLFYPYSIEVNKCSGSCNNINDPYLELRVPDVAKNKNVKVFSLMSVSNKTRHIKWHKTCKCKCWLDPSVCNNKQRRNNDKCRCEYKGLIDNRRCGKGFIWNPCNCECECDKLCDAGEYLDYKNYKYRKILTDKRVEQCSENIDENERIYNSSLNYYEKICNFCIVYIVLFLIAFLMVIYFHWYLNKDITCVKFNTNTKRKIY